MVELQAPQTVASGVPFLFAFTSPTRVSGRLRLTAGTEAVAFILTKGEQVFEKSAGHRIRGKQGSFQVSDWGEHEPETEVVLRFEGAKAWIKISG
jgi:hypothetical protein